MVRDLLDKYKVKTEDDIKQAVKQIFFNSMPANLIENIGNEHMQWSKAMGKNLGLYNIDLSLQSSTLNLPFEKFTDIEDQSNKSLIDSYSRFVEAI
jgi:hypothetical protein